MHLALVLLGRDTHPDEELLGFRLGCVALFVGDDLFKFAEADADLIGDLFAVEAVALG